MTHKKEENFLQLCMIRLSDIHKLGSSAPLTTQDMGTVQRHYNALSTHNAKFIFAVKS